MRLLNKKSQTEDFVADLIPSIVIIIVGLYIMDQIDESQNKTIEDIKTKLEETIRDKQTIGDYLKKEVSIDGKTMTFAELVALSYNNEEYQKKISSELNSLSGQTVALDMFCLRVTCIQAHITYPDNTVFKTSDDSACTGEEHNVFLPSYSGQTINMRFDIKQTTGLCTGI